MSPIPKIPISLTSLFKIQLHFIYIRPCYFCRDFSLQIHLSSSTPSINSFKKEIFQLGNFYFRSKHIRRSIRMAKRPLRFHFFLYFSISSQSFFPSRQQSSCRRVFTGLASLNLHIVSVLLSTSPQNDRQ